MEDELIFFTSFRIPGIKKGSPFCSGEPIDACSCINRLNNVNVPKDPQVSQPSTLTRQSFVLGIFVFINYLGLYSQIIYLSRKKKIRIKKMPSF